MFIICHKYSKSHFLFSWISAPASKEKSLGLNHGTNNWLDEHFFCILIYDCYVHIGNTQYYKYSRSGLVFFANFLPGLGNHLCFVVLVIFIRYSRWNWGLLLSRLLTSSCKLSFNTWFTSHDLVGIGKLCSYGKLKR